MLLGYIISVPLQWDPNTEDPNIGIANTAPKQYHAPILTPPVCKLCVVIRGIQCCWAIFNWCTRSCGAALRRTCDTAISLPSTPIKNRQTSSRPLDPCGPFPYGWRADRTMGTGIIFISWLVKVLLWVWRITLGYRMFLGDVSKLYASSLCFYF